jgi:hypothetical protein
LRGSLVGVCCAVRFRNCSRLRSVYSERTLSVPRCQYPDREVLTFRLN